jgi:hypothetical protein
MRDIPQRDEYAHFFQPWRVGDNSAADFARDALERAGPGGWILAGNTTGYSTAYYQRVHGGPQNARVYVFDRCLTDLGRERLTISQLREHLGRGGRALVVPGSGAEQMLGDEFELDKAEELWRVVLPTSRPSP